MKELLKKYNIELSDTELEKFEKFLEIFKEKNSQINLSAIREDEAIIEKHFIDSIMLNTFLDFNEYIPLSPTLSPQGRKGEEIPSPLGGGLGRELKVADLGTGGGFPGIPLAIVNPEVEFTLIDSV
jgi:16S rRNA (guanine527-N7)-methyltransferase